MLINIICKCKILSFLNNFLSNHSKQSIRKMGVWDYGKRDKTISSWYNPRG